MSNLGQNPSGYKTPPMTNQQMQQNMQQMMMQAIQSGNPEAYVQNLLKQNPEFAKQLQGTNVQQYVMNIAQQRGFNIQNMFPRR